MIEGLSNSPASLFKNNLMREKMSSLIVNAMCWIVHKFRGKVSKELGRSIKHCIADRRLNEYLNNIMNKNQNAPFMLNSMAAFLSYTKLAL